MLSSDMLSWMHWQQDLKSFIINHASSNGIKMHPSYVVCDSSKSKGEDLHLIFVQKGEDSTSLPKEVVEELCSVLPKVSRDWRYQIDFAKHVSGRIALNLHKPAVCIGAIQTTLNMCKEQHEEQPVTLYLDADPDAAGSSLTVQRLLLVRDVTCRLLTFTGHSVTEMWRAGGSDAPSAAVSAAQNLVRVTGNARLGLPRGPAEAGAGPGAGDGGHCRAVNVVVEPVVSRRTGKKEVEVTTTEYQRRRQAGLLEVGRGRPGGSAEQAALLAQASVAHELLSVSANSPCRVSTEREEASSAAADRAVFALYNYARLRALLERFEAEVAAGVYPALPTVAQIGHEFHRLGTEDEWELVWTYLLPFPVLLDECAGGALLGRPALHRLCAFLAGLSQTFSRYYSRTHVLTPPRDHLTSTLHVRVHLLKAVDAAFQLCFRLLGYQPPTRM